MTENDLGRALLRGEDSIDIEALTQRVLRRDRRRMWWLGIGCVIAWMLVVMLPWSTILPMLAKVEQNESGIKSIAVTAADHRVQSNEMVRIIHDGTIATFIGSVASIFLAAVCTVSLIVLSRRATLRQVNARLREISLEVRKLGTTRS